MKLQPKQIHQQFLSLQLRPKNMLTYTARVPIETGVRDAAARFYGSILDIGCGFMPYRELIESNPDVEKYIGVDLENSEIYEAVEPDMRWNGELIPLEDKSVDCVMATEFLEHYPETEKILKEILRVMRPGGRLFATVPFIWNLHEIPYDEYRFTPYSIKRHLRNSGFTDISVRALGGWSLSLAQMIGLWATFSKMPRLLRPLIKLALFPFYAFLVKIDRPPNEFDGLENSMFTGLRIDARK